MAIVLSAIDAAARQHGRAIEPTCLSAFEGNNLERFREVFSDTYWLRSKSNLTKVSELYGIIAARLSLLLEPHAQTVSMAIFKEAGAFVRRHCPVAESRASLLAEPLKKGDWCTWPPA